jgi:hypothetical protein
MRALHRITFCAALAVAGCGSKKEVEYARHSRYDADFAIVYGAALDATRDLYPNLNENPGPGKIATAWHQVTFATNSDDVTNQQTMANQPGMGMSGMNGMNSPAASMAGMPTRLAYKRYFIRFDVSVLGGRPWRVKVVGHASEWDPGAAMPTELHGPARPHWLEGRTEALQVAIYKRVKQYAVPAKEEVADTKTEDVTPKADPSQFKNVPAPAAARLASLKDALVRRDTAALRTQLADDVVWSLGGGTGADAAMAMWQADPAQLDAMAGVIGGACSADNPKRVACPGPMPAAGAYQLVIEVRGDAWQVTSFVKSE